jgi:hypothetical protein
MKKIIQGLLCIEIATMLSGCTQEQEYAKKHPLERAYFLIGKWQNNSETITEMWEKESDSVLLGKSYSLRNADTVSSERIRLEAHGEAVFYIPVVKNQNAGEAVKFKLVSSDANQLVFENSAHDFPQKISYSLITTDSLFAEISGMYKGQQQSEKFPMHRVK